MILGQLTNYLEKVHAIPDCQLAYRQLYSTETTVCSVVKDLLELMDEGKCGLLVMLGLSATFDTVVHEILLNDLRSIGIVDEALQYLNSYIKDRTCCVQIGNCFSSTKALTRSASPQAY